jgi:hypothetical protein
MRNVAIVSDMAFSWHLRSVDCALIGSMACFLTRHGRA